MAISRYQETPGIVNDVESYKEVFKKRDVKQILQLKTAKLRFPTSQEIATLTVAEETWHVGQRLSKLAYKYYSGRSNLWWVIAFYNRKPTEAHFKQGDTVRIPMPLGRILQYLGY